MDKKQKLILFKDQMKLICELTRKHLTKKHPKYNDLYDQAKEIQNIVSSDTYITTNADNYINFLSYLLSNPENHSKLSELCLEVIIKLFQEEYFDLTKIIENKQMISINKFNNIAYLNKTNLDFFLDIIIKLFSCLDEQVWLLMTKLFYVVIVEKGNKYKVYQDSLLKIIRILVRIYLTTKKQTTCDTVKAYLKEIIQVVYFENEIMNNQNLNQILCNLSFTSSSLKFTGDDFMDQNNYIAIIKSPIERLVSKMLLQGVDDVCLFAAKIQDEESIEGFSRQKVTNVNLPMINPYDEYPSSKNLNKKSEDDEDSITDVKDDEANESLFINKLSLSTTNKNKSKPNTDYKSFISSTSENSVHAKANILEEKLTDNAIFNIPLRSVPLYNTDIDLNPKYFTLRNPRIKNEAEEESGSFGWCCICRQAAEFYCKITRAPVCSLKCKTKLLKEEEILNKYMNGENISEDNYSITRLTDCISIFKAIANLSNFQVSNNIESLNIKSKLLSLEILHSLFEKPGNVLINLKEITNIVKEDLMNAIIKNCLSNNIQLFSLSISLFFKIWHLFRTNLKLQISIFIEKVLLKILDSDNSEFILKLIVLDEFYKISGIAKFYVEIFVNYDCDIEEKDLLNRIINSFCKISQGKFAKSELIKKEEEFSLRLKAIETITMMVLSLFHLAQDQTAVQYSKAVEDMKDHLVLDESDDINYQDLSVQFNTISNQQNNEFNQKLDESKKRKNEIKIGVEKFNLKIKNGLLYLRKIGIIRKDNEAADISHFFKTADGLNKNLIGDFIGENNELSLKVLEEYTSSFNFKSLSIIESIRFYLSSFQLPGEGQKIDRIMQHFANKYSIDNPTEFKRADLAYYIAFAIIMIQTEIHNPHVKNKRGIKGFFDMCRQFGTKEEISDEYIQKLYKDIELKPITLVEFEELKEKNSIENKADIYKMEIKRIYEESSAQLKTGKNKQYLKICEVEHIEPLINSVWSSLLAVYSLNLEDCDDWNINYSCIEGLGCCIKLCSLLSLTMLRDAFVKCLVKLTYLLQGKEIKEKHLSCLKTVLTIAQQEIHCFYGSWRVILQCISSVEFYHMAISGVRNDMDIFVNELKFRKRTENEIKIERLNLEKISEITSDDYDFIFIESVKLEEESFLEFVKALCDISKEEVQSQVPRLFSLQKLVEVADINMNRIQIQWFKIWKIISDFLIELGSNKSSFIAEKAVDSLRQLARKFLQKEELGMYHFQKEFLQPFETIYLNNKDVYKIKEFVITCITMIVIQQIGSIRSGWLVIFSLFGHSAKDVSMEIIKKAFDTLLTIFDKYIEYVLDVYPDLISCMTKFSTYFPENVLMELLKSYNFITEQNQYHSLIFNLSIIALDERDNIRKQAIAMIFNVVNNFYLDFDKKYWEIFFVDIVLKLIHTIKYNKLASSLETLFLEVCDLFFKYFDKIDFLLEEFMEEIIDTIINDNEAIALTGLEALKYLINKLEDSKDESFWSIICVSLSELFNVTSQVEMLSLEINKIKLEEYQQIYQEVVYKNIVFCIIQHNLIEICENIFITKDLNKFNQQHCIIILKSLKESFTLAYDFNCEFKLRKLISIQFMSDLNQVAALFKQQQDGIRLYYKLLLKIYFNSKFEDIFKKSCKTQAIIDALSILNQFADRVNYYNEEVEMNIENERLINNMYPIILDDVFYSLEEFLFLDESSDIQAEFFSVLINCIPCNILDVRLKLREYMEKLYRRIKENEKSRKSSNSTSTIK